MSIHTSLTPVDLDPRRARLETLEAELDARERELVTLKTELHRLQTLYLDKVGPVYAELGRLEAAVAELEIAAGLRPAEEPDDSAEETSDAASSILPCSGRPDPSDELKRMFRGLAKTIHPDLALDEPARCRRHSLMAEANRAYAERDEDRLRLILSTWQHSPDFDLDDDPAAAHLRVDRRLAQIDERLIAIHADLADLRTSAIWRLKTKIDEARSQGWDLFGEMILQVKREISRATARRATLERTAAKH